MLLGFISLNVEAQVFGFQDNTDLVTSIFLYWFPATMIFSLAFIGFFYRAKSTKKLLIFTVIIYTAYVYVRALGTGGGGYIRSNYHELLVDGYLTNYGIAGLTFNVFLAPLVLAINMYVFDILFKKRFQRKQQNNQGKA
jgi:hypothetical protein